MEFLFVCFVFLFSFLFPLNICAVNFASLPLRGKRSRPYKFILLSMDCSTRARETISFYNWAINMSPKLLTLNVRGLNSSRKRRQVFRWLHLQRSDIIFLQETYSSTETIKRWEAEWGGKVVASHGTTYSNWGVMVLFKPNVNVSINKTLADENVPVQNYS